MVGDDQGAGRVDLPGLKRVPSRQRETCQPQKQAYVVVFTFLVGQR
jgi:hypothetical protein